MLPYELDYTGRFWRPLIIFLIPTIWLKRWDYTVYFALVTFQYLKFLSIQQASL